MKADISISIIKTVMCHLNLMFFFITRFWHRPLKHCQESLLHKLLYLMPALTSASMMFLRDNRIHCILIQFTDTQRPAFCHQHTLEKFSFKFKNLLFSRQKKQRFSTVFLYDFSPKLKCSIRALHLENATKLHTCHQRKVCYDSKSRFSKIFIIINNSIIHS